MSVSIGIVGGGILGAALLHHLTEQHPEASFTLFEKEEQPGAHQTGHNSGVVHAGLYYAPGSLKASLTRRGVELIREFTRLHGLPYEECGKLLIATSEQDVAQLQRIAQTARVNGVPGVRMLRGMDEIREVEPHAVGVAALHSPTTAITDYARITQQLLEVSQERGATVRLGAPVTDIAEAGGKVRVMAHGYPHFFDHLVTCTGLQSDRTARLTGGSRFPTIIPFAGNFYTLSSEKAALVRGLIYPVPDPAYPFLGVHLTPMVDGRVTIGPDAFLSLKREGYRRGSFSLRDSFEIAFTGAFWRFAFQNMRAAVRQARDGSKRVFAKRAGEFVPGIEPADLGPGHRGVRAQALRSDGSLEEDFVIEHRGRITHVRNAPSPAATSSMAIAEYIAERLPSPGSE